MLYRGIDTYQFNYLNWFVIGWSILQDTRNDIIQHETHTKEIKEATFISKESGMLIVCQTMLRKMSVWLWYTSTFQK